LSGAFKKVDSFKMLLPKAREGDSQSTPITSSYPSCRLQDHTIYVQVKKIKKSVKLKKLKKLNHKKNRSKLLEYVKKYFIQFGFGFISLKLKS